MASSAPPGSIGQRNRDLASTSDVGKDGFHSVPDFSPDSGADTRDAVERVPAGFNGTKRNTETVKHSSQLSTLNPQLKLPASNARVIEFDYTACDFVGGDKARFKYRLEGFDKDWVDARTRRRAFYSNLRPGNYRFQVIACDHNGVWNESGALLAFRLTPHFSETHWFQAACVLAGLGAIFGVFHWRARMQRLVHLNSLAAERARITRDLHDDLGSSVTYVSRLIEQARAEPEKVSKSDELLGRVQAKLQEISRTVGQAVWSANPKQDTLESLAAYLCQFAEEFLEPANLRPRFDLPNPFPHVPVAATHRHSLFLVIKEALHNIVKHAGATEVWLRVSVEQNAFTIIIEDKGCGFSVGQASSLSQGLSNMRNRVEEIGGRFNLTTRPGAGTQVEVKMPFQATDAHR